MVHPRPLLPYLTSSYLTLPYLYLISWKGEWVCEEMDGDDDDDDDNDTNREVC
uniref:Bm10768, isoform b n=1 Tax=Brugia malayi TaxID=6279 RepID=A0A0J9Y069_BRUMA|nr:Bm10768, isoform b [Brugia malayi]